MSCEPAPETGEYIPIPQGPTNKELIDFGYLVIGLNDSMFGRTDEEYGTGMVLLRAMMAEFPFDRLCYDFNSARPHERSGISHEWITAVGSALGERIAASLPGKALLPQYQALKARSFSTLCAAANCPPPQKWAHGTPAGAGQWPGGTTFMGNRRERC